MSDTELLLVNANSHLKKESLTWAVVLGIGPTKNVWPAPTTGSSTVKEFAFLSQINALLSTLLEIVSAATKDMS